MNRTVLRGLVVLMFAFVIYPVHALDNGMADLRRTGKAFASVAKTVSPSVVFIQIEGKAPVDQAGSVPFGGEWPFGDDLFKRFFGDRFPGAPQSPGQRREQPAPRVGGQGSGFVFKVKDGLLSDKTYILTNNHVVQNAEKIRVKFQDGREFDAKVTGTDPQSDVAVIEINDIDAPALKLADSSRLEVGEWVVAIGNPFGLSNTLTVGVVSATGRTSLGISDYEDFIQTDAAINPGNSGGPLVNLDGDVVGINTAIFSRSGGYMGLGFAIPSNLAKSIALQLIDKGTVTRGYLGVLIQPLNPELAESFELPNNTGILVAQVTDDSPASRAGLKPGDVIVAYRGKPVNDVGGFRNRIAMTAPGKSETLTVIRDGKRIDLQVTIGKMDKEKVVVAKSAQSNAELGMTVQDITPDIASQYNIKSGKGVIVTDVLPGSAADAVGIDTGTVILEVNRQPVNSAAQFKKLVSRASNDKNVLMLVRKDDAQRFVVLSR